MGQACYWLCCLAAVGFGVMAVIGQFTHNNVGFDYNRLDGKIEWTTYYRLLWMGDGGLQIGYWTMPHPPKDVWDGTFDFAALVLHPPIRLEGKTWWNRRGFWFVTRPEDDPATTELYPDTVAAHFVGVPAWLPALLFGTWPLRRIWLRWRATSKSSAESRS